MCAPEGGRGNQEGAFLEADLTRWGKPSGSFLAKEAGPSSVVADGHAVNCGWVLFVEIYERK